MCSQDLLKKGSKRNGHEVNGDLEYFGVKMARPFLGSLERKGCVEFSKLPNYPLSFII